MAAATGRRVIVGRDDGVQACSAHNGAKPARRGGEDAAPRPTVQREWLRTCPPSARVEADQLADQREGFST
jgi:hypothetical protein